MQRIILVVLVILLICLPAHSQVGKIWTLDDCICYAEEHSIDVQKQILSADESKLTLREGKWALVPSLSASSGYTVSTGRVLDPTTYQFVQTKLTGNSNTSVSGEITLFEGGKKIYLLNKARMSLRSAILKESSIKYNLKLNVTAAYLDVLCAKEHVHVAEESASIVEAQLKRSMDLLEAGNITESDVLQIQSQLYVAQNGVASAKHSELLAKLDLCDLLEIDDYLSLRIAEPQETDYKFMLIDIDAIVDHHPDYQSSVLNREMAAMDYAVARADLYPKILLSAGYGSSFSDARTRTLQNPDGSFKNETYPFLEQYKDNSSAYFSVGLKIPILSKLSARNAVRRAKIAEYEAELSMHEVRKRIRRSVLQAQIDCQSAEDSLLRAQEEARCAEEALHYVAEKYNSGAINYLSWNTAFVEFSQARHKMIGAKYSYQLNYEILRYLTLNH